MDTARPPPVRVLVVDDCRDAADSLAVLLRLWGYETAVAYDGPAALALAAAEPPAAALLVAVTGRGREEDVQRCGKAGFDLHVYKPFDPEEVRRVLAARLPPPPRDDAAASL